MTPKNQKGIFKEAQIELAYKFYKKEQQKKFTFWEWVNEFWRSND